jgi:hypothetical protein
MKSKFMFLSVALLLSGIPCRGQAPVERPLGDYDKLVSQLKSNSLVGEPIRAGETAIIPFASVTFELVGGDAAWDGVAVRDDLGAVDVRLHSNH